MTFNKIILPTRAQPDTIIAIFILKSFGETKLPGINNASIGVWQMLPTGETEESLSAKGILLIDLGGGRFDHHGKSEQTTSSDLVAEYLGVQDDPALTKLLEFARRDDFLGKGTISMDPLDRAFGLAGLVAALNKSLADRPEQVPDYILPLIWAHYNEESRRTKELPKEFEEKSAKGEVKTFEVRQRDKKLRVVIINSDNSSMPGYLRSQQGGRFDVVAQWLGSGHLNILTRPTKHVDLRQLAALIRLKEAEFGGKKLQLDLRELARPGRINESPNWYYDPATNSIQNGGINPKEVLPTKIPRIELQAILESGLSIGQRN
jgi:hypothetical protein